MKKSFISKVLVFLLAINVAAVANANKPEVKQNTSFIEKAKNIVTSNAAKKVLLYGVPAAVAAGLAYVYFPESAKNFFNSDHLYEYGSVTKQISVELVGDSLEAAIGETLKETVPSIGQKLINVEGIASSTTQQIARTFNVDVAIPLAPLNYVRKNLFGGVVNSKTVQLGASALAGGAVAYGIDKANGIAKTVASIPTSFNRKNIKKILCIGIPAVAAGGLIACVAFNKFPLTVQNLLNPNHAFNDIKTEATVTLVKRSLEECIFANLKQGVPKLAAWTMEKFSKATLQEIAAKTAEKVSQQVIQVNVTIPMKAVNAARQSAFSGVINSKNIRMATSLVAGAAAACGGSALANTCYNFYTNNSKKVKKALMYSAPLAVAGLVGYGVYTYFPKIVTNVMSSDTSNIVTSCTIPTAMVSDRLADGRGIQCAIDVSSGPLNALRESVCNADRVRLAASTVAAGIAGYATTYLKKPAEKLCGYFSGSKTSTR